ncbi:DUF2325 domain-containing protein [Motiliproteus coralliicola]|nr:DUF2325 domain-containing protein [Motiliproteus coralliicola]
MCDQCKPMMPTPSNKARLKLWEIPRQYHCPVVGTCLSMAELRKVQNNCRREIGAGLSDYQLHAGIVSLVGQNGATSRRVHKLLERKYQRWIKHYSKLDSDQQQQAFWDQSRRSGEIAGPFWALLSHHSTSQILADRALGEVHMLSHLQGASNRADLQYTARLEKQLIELQQNLEKIQLDHAAKLNRKEDLLAAQQRALDSMRALIQPAQQQDQQLWEQLSESRKQARTLSRRFEWMEQQLVQRDLRLTELEHGQQGLLEQLDETRHERDTLERALEQLLIQRQPVDGPNSMEWDSAEFDLQGKRLGYIGGRATVTPRLRTFVESLNGELICHDGGKEDSRAGLCYGLANADLVFCPIDCVSHDACLRVKRFCKQHNKPFIPLRSASLSAFSHGLKIANDSHFDNIFQVE